MVSKNGHLLMNLMAVFVRNVKQVLDELTQWMPINREGIFGAAFENLW